MAPKTAKNKTARQKTAQRKTAQKSPPRKKAARRVEKLYTFEALLTGGPVSETFVDENPVVSRTLQMRGAQSLEDLHWAIFAAFDRDDDHLFEFAIGGRGARELGAKRYQRKGWVDDFMEGSAPADASRTRIDSLELKARQTFGYWFDFGDDWHHRVKVKAIEEQVPVGKYPREIARIGKSPPQYPGDEEDWDEEDEDDEDDE